ncbi:MAG: threonine synthase [Planctomycetes bacterium]|nr:threonine synthase [Planctomycetota bacterium]
MEYVSTRGQIRPIGFSQAVMMGLADDGGLVVPKDIPDVRGRCDDWRGLPYEDLALEVMTPFVGDIPRDDMRDMIHRTYDVRNYGGPVAPVARVGQMFVLELFHGPTMAFKDVALQLLGNLFEYILARRASGARAMNILAATSGDTGSAAICGVRGRKGINIFVMHPHGRVSPIQERQMTAVLDDNVHNIALEGSFDDCQRIMKELFGDLEFKNRYCLGAVNSVNWARVLAQIVYYFSTAAEVQKLTGAAKVRFAVPTGNFGDVLAGWYAMKMGAPISGLILATNENDILARFFSTGEYSLAQVRQTLSPSMDIQLASNFERYLYYRVGQDGDRLRGLMKQFARTGRLTVPCGCGPAGVSACPGGINRTDPDFQAGAAKTADVLDAIRQCHSRHGYVLDPHTACGWAVAEKFLPGDPIICLATAHPAKFPAAIEQATGRNDLARHPRIDKLMSMSTRSTLLANDKQAVREFIVNRLERP